MWPLEQVLKDASEAEDGMGNQVTLCGKSGDGKVAACTFSRMWPPEEVLEDASEAEDGMRKEVTPDAEMHPDVREIR